MNPIKEIGITDIFKVKIIFTITQKTWKKKFEIKPHYKRKFQKLKTQVIGDSKYAIVHIRLKDFKTFGPDFLGGPDLTLPLNYYHKIIEKIPNDYKVIFLSDDIQIIKEDFSV